MRIKSGNVYKPLGAVSSTVDTKSSLAVAVFCIVIIFIHRADIHTFFLALVSEL